LVRSALFTVDDEMPPVDAHGDVLGLESRHRRRERKPSLGLMDPHRHRLSRARRHVSSSRCRSYITMAGSDVASHLQLARRQHAEGSIAPTQQP
jgi:hypothetical protein